MIKYIIKNNKKYLRFSRSNRIAETGLEDATIIDTLKQALWYQELGRRYAYDCEIKELECKEIE